MSTNTICEHNIPDILFLRSFNLNSTCSARGNVSYLFFFRRDKHTTFYGRLHVICEHNLIKCCMGDDLLEGLLKGLRVRAAGLKLFMVSIDDLQCCLCIGGSLHLSNNGAKMCFITDIFMLTYSF
jgi:hypothetical protein